MNYYLGVLVLATYISTSVALPPCVCTRDLRPVCGTDGTTYNNECLLDCARTRGKSDLAVERRGKCEFQVEQADRNSCMCTLEYLPFCGSDGRTYPNRCTMECQARARNVEIVKVHDGECRQKRDIALPDRPCICTMIYRPVCASDGNSYPNQCTMDCEARERSLELVKVHDGECRQKRDVAVPDRPCICTMIYRPVCASDGNSYPNQCTMDCEAREKSLELVKVHDGECRQKRDIALPDRPCICTMIDWPVCASDGNSYPNQCTMDCEARERSLKLVKVHDGECRQKRDIALPDRSCICTMIYRPVCASDGNSYPNQCTMDCEARERSLELVKVHDGECRQKRDIALPDRPCICTMIYRPVCASDGNSYPNQCTMDCEARERSLELVKIHDGECRPKRNTVKVAELKSCVCTKEKKPVCGTDGHTYANPCLLRCAKQTNADLDIQHRGRCVNEESVVPDIPKMTASCTCSRDLEPVCATNGETYPNECLMKCAGAQLDRQGSCDGVTQQVVLDENSS